MPTVSPGGGIVRLDWIAGPCASSTKSPTVVSFTDFRAEERSDLDEIFTTGIALAENWPIMHGAVGLWLWGKPAELRGGSLSFWRTEEDLRRFVGWRVHTAIVRQWRQRVSVRSRTWHDNYHDPHQAWTRAEALMIQARGGK